MFFFPLTNLIYNEFDKMFTKKESFVISSLFLVKGEALIRGDEKCRKYGIFSNPNISSVEG